MMIFWLSSYNPLTICYLDIRLDWLTYNKETEDRKLIDLLVAYGEPFPLKDVDGNELVGGPNSHVALLARLDQSQTPSTEGSSSSLRTKSETSVSKRLKICFHLNRMWVCKTRASSFSPFHLAINRHVFADHRSICWPGIVRIRICCCICCCISVLSVWFDVLLVGFWRRTVWGRQAKSTSFSGFNEETV